MKTLSEKIKSIIIYLFLMFLTIMGGSLAIGWLVQKSMPKELYQCDSRYEEGYQWGQKVGYQEGYDDAGKDALKLIKCYKTPEPKIEDCLNVFLLEDYGKLPNLNPDN